MTTPLESAPPQARLRSGTAARLAGVPVATLRVWERRYAVVAAPKSATGQRLYSPQDVQRLRLMRQLTETGHAIGTLAALGHEQLLELHAALQPSAGGAGYGLANRSASVSAAAFAGAPARNRQVLLVGTSLQARMKAVPGCQLLPVLDNLPLALARAAMPEAAAQAVDTLVVHLPSLQPDDLPRVARLRGVWPAAQTLLIYAFGTEQLAESLRDQGVVVQREPVNGRDLARLLAPAQGLGANTTDAGSASADSTGTAGESALGPVRPRRYSDTALAALAEMTSTVACECPRHLAEIVVQLAGFEQYSAQCLARNSADAALHQRLSALAGAARTQFEQALADVAAAEGLVVPEN